MLEEMADSNASTGLHIMPIIPYITDTRENIEELYRRGADARVSYVLPAPLNLRGRTKPAFLNFIKNEYPDRYQKLVEMYSDSYAPKEYQRQLYTMVNSIRDKYGLCANFDHEMKQKLTSAQEQMSIFDL